MPHLWQSGLRAAPSGPPPPVEVFLGLCAPLQPYQQQLHSTITGHSVAIILDFLVRPAAQTMADICFGVKPSGVVRPGTDLSSDKIS